MAALEVTIAQAPEVVAALVVPEVLLVEDPFQEAEGKGFCVNSTMYYLR